MSPRDVSVEWRALLSHGSGHMPLAEGRDLAAVYTAAARYAEAWPYLDHVVLQSVRRTGWIVEFSSSVIFAPHLHPTMPCGCVCSTPPCSLEHAVRVTKEE